MQLGHQAPVGLYGRHRTRVPCFSRRNCGRVLKTVPTEAAAVDAPTSAAVPHGGGASDVKVDPAAPRAVTAEAAQPGPDLFDWTRSWYAVAALEYLDPKAPNAVQLLGSRLVVWLDKDGQWRCFEDLCPHRLAPLSEGRIHESGQLQCTYHGWRWDASGACTSIPQIPDEKAHAVATASPRACVKNYPTQVLQGMLWVFADPSPQGWRAAATTHAAPTSAAAELVEGRAELKGPWFQRDAPLSYDILMENMTDPSHVPQSHHGVAGDRESDQRMTITPVGPATKEGFTMAVKMPPGSMGDYTFEYRAPSLVRYHFPGVTMLLYATPTGKGTSRVIMSFVGPKGSKQSRPPTPQLPPLLNWFIDHIVDPIPALSHVLNRNPIMDGDGVLMMLGGHTLYTRGTASSWSRQYYMPATADLAVLTWRKWLDGFGAALPVLPKAAGDAPPLPPREEVFDRYNQHTKHCPHCRATLHNTNVALVVFGTLAAVAAASAIIGVAVHLGLGAADTAGGYIGLAASAGSWIGLKAAGVRFALWAAKAAVAAMAVTAGLWRFRKLFIYEDYIHAHR